MRAPTGEQYTISTEVDGHRLEATVTEVAAGLRAFTIDGVDLVEPHDEDARPAKAQGIVLAPWPGRVANAQWQDERGDRQQLWITEPATGNAIHGLLRFTPYRLIERADSFVTLGATVFPQNGYDYTVETTVRYELGEDGLQVTHTAENVGKGNAPFALGTHPYLAVGRTPANELTLTVPATTMFLTDARTIPVGVVAVDDPHGKGVDLRGGVRLASLDLDAGFGGMVHEHGRAVSTLIADDGTGVAMWQDEAFGYSVVFTPRDFPAFDGARHVAAVEPMTAPANAFNSGEGLLRLVPGQRWRGVWGLSPIGW